jgi:hypothetical protein
MKETAAARIGGTRIIVIRGEQRSSLSAGPPQANQVRMNFSQQTACQRGKRYGRDTNFLQDKQQESKPYTFITKYQCQLIQNTPF